MRNVVMLVVTVLVMGCAAPCATDGEWLICLPLRAHITLKNDINKNRPHLNGKKDPRA